MNFINKLFPKWELVEEGKITYCTRYNDLLGKTGPIIVLVDVFRKKKLNGLYKYRTVGRE